MRKQATDGVKQIRRTKRDANKQGPWQEVSVPHQIGHDVMVAFDVFPDADNLQEGRAELIVNLTGLQHNKA